MAIKIANNNAKSPMGNPEKWSNPPELHLQLHLQHTPITAHILNKTIFQIRCLHAQQWDIRVYMLISLF